MKINRIRKFILCAGAALATSVVSGVAQGALAELSDDALSEVTGQALFLSDKIVGSTADANPYNDFTFYRMALDGDLLMNLNIDKLQLGCGGFNEGLVNNACDIDVDFASFTGFDRSPDSDFLLERPYLEIAIKNDQDKTRREIAGVKIGAQSATGVLSIGRIYSPGQTNQEHGGVCGTSSSSVDSVGSPNRLSCHSGANNFSGFIRAELSATGNADAGFLGSGDVCFGWTRLDQRGSDPCGAGNAFFTTIKGTRFSHIGVVNAGLSIFDGSGILGAFSDANADLKVSLRFLHEIVLDGKATDASRRTRDFFLSFQRERVAYPIYDVSQPYNTGEGNSAYSVAANTGWWMNLTYAAALDLDAGNLELGLGDALQALGEGANLVNINLGQTPADNCFGSAQFC